MTQLEWQQLEAAVAKMTDAEKQRLATLLMQPEKEQATGGRDPIIGSFADESDLIEFVIEQTNLARETHPFRTGE
jgi:hypothetical protein